MRTFVRTILLLIPCVAFPLSATSQTARSPQTGAGAVRFAGFDEILADVRDDPASVTIVNMWATWCAPCIEEFPDFVRLAESHRRKGLRVVFVSVDSEDEFDSVLAFLREQSWSEPSYIKTGKDDAFVRAFHEGWSGAVPATFIYGRSGELAWFREGKTTFDVLQKAAEKILERG